MYNFIDYPYSNSYYRGFIYSLIIHPNVLDVYFMSGPENQKNGDMIPILKPLKSCGNFIYQ